MPAYLYHFVGFPGWTAEALGFAVGCGILWFIIQRVAPRTGSEEADA